MKTRLKNVCETNGECQEEAVVEVSVWRRSPRTPIAVIRCCAEHGHRFITSPGLAENFDIMVDQGEQLTLL